MNARALSSRRVPRPHRIYAGIGLGAAALFLAGIAMDVRDFDRTSGGYEPPYTGFTGEPIDWSRARLTPDGLRKAGYVIDVHLSCADGMIHGEILGLAIPFRRVSERAIVVHRPREACRDRGFEPRF